MAATRAPSRIFISHLAGKPVFDQDGDQVGRIRDVVVTMHTDSARPRVLGMVSEVTGKRRVVILDEVARAVYGEPQPRTPFQYEASFGKTLYAWRILNDGCCDGCAPDLTAKIYFIATQAEYTPPVIYSQDERAKLVYLIQARPEKPDALRVGQPVSVFLQPKPGNVNGEPIAKAG